MTIKYSKFTVMIILVIILGVLLSGFLLKKIYLDSSSPFKESVIGENLQITSEWKELETKNLIKLEGDRQFLSINITEPFEGDFSKKGVRTPNGDVFNFEVKLVDEEGREYPLSYEGFLGKWHINYAYEKGKLPTDKTYKKILIRSDVPITVEKIIWIYYYAKDLR